MEPVSTAKTPRNTGQILWKTTDQWNHDYRKKMKGSLLLAGSKLRRRLSYKPQMHINSGGLLWVIHCIRCTEIPDNALVTEWDRP